MRVTILYFAAVRDLVGKDEEPLDLPPNVPDIAALAPYLERRHPRLSGRLSSVRFAVDEEFALPETRLHEGAVIALIPPVAGG